MLSNVTFPLGPAKPCLPGTSFYRVTKAVLKEDRVPKKIPPKLCGCGSLEHSEPMRTGKGLWCSVVKCFCGSFVHNEPLHTAVLHLHRGDTDAAMVVLDRLVQDNKTNSPHASPDQYSSNHYPNSECIEPRSILFLSNAPSL